MTVAVPLRLLSDQLPVPMRALAVSYSPDAELYGILAAVNDTAPWKLVSLTAYARPPPPQGC